MIIMIIVNVFQLLGHQSQTAFYLKFLRETHLVTHKMGHPSKRPEHGMQNLKSCLSQFLPRVERL